MSMFMLYGSASTADPGAAFYLKGYVKYLHATWMPASSDDWLLNGTVHHRLDIDWLPSDHLQVGVGMRNRFIYGDWVKRFPSLVVPTEPEHSFFHMYHKVFRNASAVGYSEFDRLHLDYSRQNWQIVFGRQRINWGVNLIWNPNDVFNAASYFDFDYEERPGTDAVSVQYYTGVTSSLQVVYTLDRQNALAARYAFNACKVDWQVLCGQLYSDYIIGGGWSGQVLSGAVRGEAICFIPRDKRPGAETLLLASVSADYTFKNQLYVQVSAWYNDHGRSDATAQTSVLLQPTASIKTLFPIRYALFAQAGKPVTPLIRTELYCVVNPDDGSAFCCPSATVSVAKNVDMMILGQLLCGRTGTFFGRHGQLYFLRWKWSF